VGCVQFVKIVPTHWWIRDYLGSDSILKIQNVKEDQVGLKILI
jgi:hypothetical protein